MSEKNMENDAAHGNLQLSHVVYFLAHWGTTLLVYNNANTHLLTTRELR